MDALSPEVVVVPAGHWVRFLNLLKRTFMAAFDDGVFGIAKGAAYSGLLAFFPAMASLTAILVQIQAESVSHAISRFLGELAPPGSEDLVRYVFTQRGQRPLWLLIAGTLLSVWAATGAIMSLMEGFQAVYKLPGGRSFLKQRAVAVLLVFAAALPALGASSLMLFGTRSERAIVGWLHLVPQGEQFQWWVVVVSRVFDGAGHRAAVSLRAESSHEEDARRLARRVPGHGAVVACDGRLRLVRRPSRQL
jgi:membrane protein